MSDKIKKFEGEFDFLSNLHPSTFYFKSVKYKSVVHAYQSLKAKHERDAIRIRSIKSPSDVIKEGRAVEIKNDWQATCQEIMYELLYVKFNTNIFLRPKLIATGKRELGDERNFVGKLLMEVREKIINDEKSNEQNAQTIE